MKAAVRSLSVGVALFAIWLIAPAPASAGFLTWSTAEVGSQLFVNGGLGVDRLTIIDTGTTYRIENAGPGVVWGPPSGGDCAEVTGAAVSTAECSQSGITSIVVFGDGGCIPSCPGSHDTIAFAGPFDGLTRGTVIAGEGRSDTINGSPVADSIFGGAGADTMSGGAGPDSFVAEGGADTVSYADHADRVRVTIGNGPDDGSAEDGPPGARDDVGADIANLAGTAGADVLIGSAAANGIDGAAGSDRIYGLEGDDILGGAGGGDLLTGGLGADELFGAAGSDTLDAADGVADLILNCGAGADQVLLDLGIDPAPLGCES